MQTANSFQYRITSNSINLEQFFGTEGVQVSEEKWKDVEDEVGIDFPGWLDDQVVGLRVPLDQNISRRIQGFEFMQSMTIGLPYIQGQIRWAAAGRLERMSPFAQPERIWGLASELFAGRYYDFIASTSTAAIEHELNKQTLVRGRIDLLLALNIKNLIWWRLDYAPLYFGKKQQWTLDGNLYPYWVWKSFDASNRIGVAEGFSTQAWLDDAIDGGPLFEDLTDDAVGLLTDYIDQQLFVPAGWPLYTGFGGRAEIELQWRAHTSFMLGIDYSHLHNDARGVSPVQSVCFTAALRVGIGGKSKRHLAQTKLAKAKSEEATYEQLTVVKQDSVSTVPVLDTVVATVSQSSATMTTWVIRCGLYQKSVNLHELDLVHVPLRAETIVELGQTYFAVYLDEEFASEEAALQRAATLELKDFIVQQHQN
ncbi:MAG: hypothetical protein H6765_00910 [Candidatus Peribacteria bacterium]|nr:MAG: hypothetical protein H6765_00910 [Candidatus Peribacteria bacterium]